MTPSAFSPGSITCFFCPRVGSTPQTTISQGLAINLKIGVTAAILPAKSNAILFNGKTIEMQPVERVVEALAPEPVEIHLETALPLGCGFGVSAASCLATSFALDKRYNLNLSRAELGLTAHAAEVMHRTGYGDVASQLCGGIVYRKCILGPLDCQKLDVKQKTLYYRVFGPIQTSEVLSSPAIMRAIIEQGTKALDWLEGHQSRLTVDLLLERSLEFAEQTGLIGHPEVARILSGAAKSGVSATMIMLGHSVVSSAPIGPEEAWMPFEIDEEGTRWLP